MAVTQFVLNAAQIRALFALQRRTLVNTFRDHSRRHGLLASLTVSILWYGVWLGAAAFVALMPNLIGPEDFENVLPGLLLFMMGYWQLSPLVTLSLGVSLEMRKLALYPVSVGTLFVMECLLRLWTGFEMILLLAGLFGGLAWAGTSNLFLLTAGLLLFVAFNMFFSAGMRNLIERVFQKRLLREVLLVGMVSLTVLPQVLAFSGAVRKNFLAIARSEIDLPYWTVPSGLAAHVALGQATLFDVALLLAMIAAAAAFGFLMFRSSSRLTSGSTAGEQAPRIRPPAPGSFRERIATFLSSLLPEPISALVAKEIKYLWRSPRFRLPFFMGFTFGVIAWAPIMLRVDGEIGDWMRSSAVTLISIYAYLLLGPVLFLNRFGFDRGSARFYFWMPLSFPQLLAAKNAATAVYALSETILIALICAVIGLPAGPAEVAEAFVICLIALLYLTSVGNYMSLRFPVPSNPDRVSRAGTGHGLRAAVHFFLFPLSMTPIFIAMLSHHIYQDWTRYGLALTGAALLGAVVYAVTFRIGARYGRTNRERIVGHLSSGEGPIASE